MRSFWRRLLVWWMVLALPLQGMAAVAMQHCAGAPAPTSVHEAHLHADGRAHGHAEALDASGEHAAQGQVNCVPSALAAHCSEADAEPGGHSCSACSACCTTAALPTSPVGVGTPGPAPAPEFAADAAPRSFLASGPERPPRRGGA